jgi:hypothetical protein
MEYQIFFSSGQSLKVSSIVMEVINKRISEGATAFQTFQEDENSDILLVINLLQITHITKI